jgi:hypothetical protein
VVGGRIICDAWQLQGAHRCNDVARMRIHHWNVYPSYFTWCISCCGLGVGTGVCQGWKPGVCPAALRMPIKHLVYRVIVSFLCLMMTFDPGPQCRRYMSFGCQELQCLLHAFHDVGLCCTGHSHEDDRCVGLFPVQDHCSIYVPFMFVMS